MKNLFISIPMNGRSAEDIIADQKAIVSKAEEIVGEKVQMIESCLDITVAKNRKEIRHDPVWYLGRSIQLLATADYVYFAEGWENARGCKLEHTIAEAYGVNIIND